MPGDHDHDDDFLTQLLRRAAPRGVPQAELDIPRQVGLRPILVEAHVALPSRLDDLVVMASILGRLRQTISCQMRSYDREVAVFEIETRDVERVLGLFNRLTRGTAVVSGAAETGFIVEARVTHEALSRPRGDRRKVDLGPPRNTPERRAGVQRRQPQEPLLP